MIKTLKAFAGDIIIGAVILYFFNIKLFLLFLFIEVIILLENIRRLVRVFQFCNEIKILAVIRKLKITEDEISIVMEGEKRNMGDAKWKDLEGEFLKITK